MVFFLVLRSFDPRTISQINSIKPKSTVRKKTRCQPSGPTTNIENSRIRKPMLLRYLLERHSRTARPKRPGAVTIPISMLTPSNRIKTIIPLAKSPARTRKKIPFCFFVALVYRGIAISSCSKTFVRNPRHKNRGRTGVICAKCQLASLLPHAGSTENTSLSTDLSLISCAESENGLCVCVAHDEMRQTAP